MRWLLLLLICAGLSLPAGAEPRLLGRPPVQTLQPSIAVYPQNFGLIELADGGLAVASRDGVLLFDGERWSVERLPNREMVRSLARGENDDVWVGGYNSFGTLTRAPNGEWRYSELSAQFMTPGEQPAFADVWSILVAPEGTYFRTLRDVFFLPAGGGPGQRWRHEERFGAIVRLQGEVLLQFRGEGFRVRRGEAWQPLAHTAALKQLVHTLVPLDEDTLLGLGSDGRWWGLGLETLREVPMPEGLPPSSEFQKALRLRDGHLVFASGDGRLWLVAPDRGSFVILRLEQGFLSGLWQARDGSLLVSGNRTIHRVVWPPRWTALDDTLGATGNLHLAREEAGELWVFGSGGALRAEAQRNAPSRLQIQPELTQSLFDRHVLADGRALYAGGHHLLMLDAGGLRPLSDELVYPRMLQPSALHSDLVWVFTEHGLRRLELQPAPRLSPPLQRADDMRVRALVEVSSDDLWLGTERSGLWRYRLGEDRELLSAQRMGSEQGITYGPIAYAHISLWPDGSLRASTAEGLWRWDGVGAFVADSVFGLDAQRLTEERLRLVPGADGNAWAFSPTRVLALRGGRWQTVDLGGLCHGAIEQIGALADGRTFVLCHGALLLMSSLEVEAETHARQVRLTRVLRGGTGTEPMPVALVPEVPIVAPAKGFNIAFEFALAELDQSASAQYRWRLQGLREEWSPWVRATRVNYTELDPGDYRFELEARDTRGRISRAEPWPFVLLPPWYETSWARVLFAALLLSVAALSTRAYIRRRTARIEAERRRLSELVAERTAELADANRKLEDIANRDGLTGLANRRRQDAYLRAVWFQSQERQRPLSVLIVDVDHFKRYNDQHGHPAGDALLQGLSELLAASLRRSEDLVARYGGEEFLLVLPGAPAELAFEFAQSLCESVRASALGVTVSIGTATIVPTDATRLSELIECADRALYQAKGAGRDRAVAASALGALASGGTSA
ncbi:MAG: diguanylate cyclase [Lysobacterales bacterium]